MKWWKRSITSNVDIKGECNQIKEIYFETSEELIYFSDDPDSRHHKVTIDILLELIPNIKLKTYFCKLEIDAINVLQELIKSGVKSKIVLCQWEMPADDFVDSLIETLIHEQDFLFICAAGNRNISFSERTPQRIKDVIKIGAYNRSGEVASLNSKVNSDFYFPGTSITECGKCNRNGTSWSATIAAATFLIIKKWYRYPSNKKLLKTYVQLHAKPLKDTKKRLILKKPVIREQRRPSSIKLDKLGHLNCRENEAQLYIEYADVGSDLLIDSIGRELKNLNRKDIVIPLSGGIDSEAIAQAAVKHNIDFKSVIMRYIYDGEVQNEYDFKYAVDFCNENKIDYSFIDLDCNWFFEESEKFLTYATNYFVTSPQLCCHLWMLDQIKGFPVIAGDPVFVSKGNHSTLCIKPIMYYCYDYYFHKTKREGISRMLCYSPGIINSTIPIDLKLFEDKKYNKPTNKYERKMEFFRLGGFDLKHRESKLTGFEGLGKSFNDKYNGIGMRIFNKFFRRPLQSEISSPELKILVSKGYGDILKNG